MKLRNVSYFMACLACLCASPVVAEEPAAVAPEPAPTLNAAQQAAVDEVEAKAAEIVAVNKAIWEFAEVGLEEHKSSALLVEKLRANGFDVKTGVANMPTAFVASFGSGSPVIGVLAEFDALPGLSQAAAPGRQPLVEGAAGHGCGHNCLGAGGLGAVLGIKKAMEQHAIPGTIRLYGTPAEETLIGKVYMLLDGQFSDLDFFLHWHPMAKNETFSGSSKAAVSAKFSFHGATAHASGSPEQGRSALDAVELMNIGANFMREHITEDARIHYVITNGGGAPNVVPAEATVWYYVRANAHSTVEANFKRIQEIAQGAALMTRTTMTMHVDTDCHEMVPNNPLQVAIEANLRAVGPPKYTPEEHAFASRLQAAISAENPSKTFKTTLVEEVNRTTNEATKGSTDVGDISWHVPTSGARTVCHAEGLPGHSWHVVACAGSTIGEKGTVYAAKTLAATAIQLFQDEKLRAAAKADFADRMKNRKYTTLIPPGQKAPAAIR